MKDKHEAWRNILQSLFHHELINFGHGVLDDDVVEINKTEPPHRGTSVQPPQGLNFTIKVDGITTPVKTLEELGFIKEETKKYSDGELVQHLVFFNKTYEELSGRGITYIETERIVFHQDGTYNSYYFHGSHSTSLTINKELHDAITIELRKGE